VPPQGFGGVGGGVGRQMLADKLTSFETQHVYRWGRSVGVTVWCGGRGCLRDGLHQL
jgi:hypothetical protein